MNHVPRASCLVITSLLMHNCIHFVHFSYLELQLTDLLVHATARVTTTSQTRPHQDSEQVGCCVAVELWSAVDGRCLAGT